MTMFGHILAPLDGSVLAECVLPHVVSMAGAFGARITLLHVLERTGRSEDVDRVLWQINKAEAQAYLDGVSSRLSRAGFEAETQVLEGQPAERVIDFTRANHVDLIILSSHGRSGLTGWNISSVVQKIIMRANRSIMIVRAYQPVDSEIGQLHYRRVLVPLDCSPRAECVLPAAVVLGDVHEARVMLIHVVRRPEIPCRDPVTREEVDMMEHLVGHNTRIASQYLEHLASTYSKGFQSRVLAADNVTVTLHELCEKEQIDLVLLSAHGHSATNRWPYGSLVINMIVYGTHPLLIVQDLRPEDVQPSKAEVATREKKGH